MPLLPQAVTPSQHLGPWRAPDATQTPRQRYADATLTPSLR
jgi:hypothetical protein